MSDSPSLPDLSPETARRFLQACIDNYVQMFPVGMYQGLTIHDAPDLAYRIGGFPVAALNSVVRSIFPDTETEQRIDDMFHLFARRGLPFNWVVTPESRPENLAERLQNRGMRLNSTLLAMGRFLEDLPELQCPEGFHMEEVKSDRLLDLWARVGQISYHLPMPAIQIRIQQFQRLLESPLWPVKLYVGFQGDQAVCTSGVRLTPHSAGIYFVGTLPAHTRKGYGRWITLKALQDARDLGQQVGVLLSTQAGHHVYQRLGFHDVGTVKIYNME